ncbi:MAG: NIPSNAP family protein [Acidobacteria bacterium]|nr:NIPSNAP family protein [Acidobacteriota bacterium]
MSIRQAIGAAGIVLAFGAGFTARGIIGDAAPTVQAQGNHVWELRTYTAAPGKWENINARFRNHTLRLFAKHGQSGVAYLTPTEGSLKGNTLIYVLQHDSRAAADKFWAAFQADPEWVKAKAESEANGPITSKVERLWLEPTDYSQVK